MKQANGLKIIAVIKGIRGGIALLICVTLLRLSQNEINYQSYKSILIGYANSFEDPFLHLLADAILLIQPEHLLIVSFLFGGLFIVRISEAIGLWFDKLWGQLLALVTSLVFIPVETYFLLDKWSVLTLALIVVNLIISIFLFLVIQKKLQPHQPLKSRIRFK